MKKLIVSGCSFTFEKWNWPTFVAKHFKLGDGDLINVGMGSQGNGLIAKKLIHQVSQQLKHHKPEELMVGVMWSGVDRFEFHSEERYNSGNWGNNQGAKNVYNPTRIADDYNWYIINPGWSEMPDSHPLMEAYYQYFHSDIGAMIKTLESILLVQWFLKENKVPYFMTTYMDIFNKYETNIMDSPDIKYLYELIDFKRFIPVKGCFDFVFEHFPEGIPDGKNAWYGRHPLESGHKFFADNAVVPFLDRKLI